MRTLTLVFSTLLLAGLLGAGPESVLIDANPEARQPQVAVGPEGEVFVAFGAGNAIRFAGSRDGGRTFGEPVTVGTLPTLALGMRRGPRIAATKEAIVITAIGGEKGKGQDGDLLAWRSLDDGASWSGPVRINDVEASAREGLHGMAAAADGTIVCVWNDSREGPMAVFASRSHDGGRTWEPNRLVYRSPEGSICPCCHPSAAFAPDGSLLVMWRNDIGESRDLYLARSSDGGQTFGKAGKLGRRTWIYNKCPMDGGSIAIGPDGRAQTVWMRAQQVFLCAPGGPERLLGPGVQPWAAASDEGTHVVWLQRRSGDLLYLAPGTVLARTLAGNATDPVLASAPSGEGPVVAAWEATADDQRGIMVQVLQPADD